MESKAKRIFNEIIYVRTLISYEITDENLMLWAKSIDKIFTEVYLSTIREVVRAMQLETLEFNPQKGIQNLIQGILYWEDL